MHPPLFICPLPQQALSVTNAAADAVQVHAVHCSLIVSAVSAVTLRQATGSHPCPTAVLSRCDADTNFDYPGSCGRCYEVRCKSGLVQDRGQPVSIEKFYYLAKANSNVQDTYGRSFPGNPREGDKLQYVKCWDDARSIFIRVGDSCPCQQKKPDNTTQPQFWCCGGANHMDLNYWAFEKLAHPVYGVISVEYRPVNCQSRQPLDPVPGFVSPFIYRNDLGAGWGWRPYSSKNTVVSQHACSAAAAESANRPHVV
eukprot:GHRQ01020560.1.p1 GENE.GHRQ01020560.1~~GHRQ01020560.1.p1  ORF type:complete len:255 (+),score=66.03 GHRQ01020560.1:923-1687(+)